MEQRGPRWSPLRKRLVFIAYVGSALVLLQCEENWRCKRAWNNFKAEQKARGIPMDMADLIPKPVPADQNFALTPVIASSYSQWIDAKGRPLVPANTNVVNRLDVTCFPNGDNSLRGSWQKQSICSAVELQKYYRELAMTNIPGTKRFPVPELPGNPAPDVLYALSVYDPLVEDLREASRLPYSRFPLEYENDNPTQVLLPHLGYARQTLVLLSLRASMEIQSGQPDKALEDVQLGFKIMDAYDSKPFLISQLVCLEEFDNLLQPIFEGLAQHAWSDTQLGSLMSRLAFYDFCKDYRLAMNGDLIVGTTCVEYLRKNPKSWSDDGLFSYYLNSSIILMPNSLFYLNQLTLAELNTKCFLSILDQRTNVAARAKTAQSEVERAFANSKIRTVAARAFLRTNDRPALKFSMAETHLNLARTAIALERYRLTQGKYPETLAPLSPQYLASIPNDLIDGQPIRYRRNEDSFTLYSIGWNEKDDGGVIGYKNDNKRALDKEQGDWVWQYPVQK